METLGTLTNPDLVFQGMRSFLLLPRHLNNRAMLHCQQVPVFQPARQVRH